MNYQNLNTFREGQIVDIVGIPTMQKLRIDRISDAGVTVVGGALTPFTVLSGYSPAQLHVATENEVESNGTTNAIVERAPHGFYNNKMKNMKIPKGSFTIKQLAEFNTIPSSYACDWVRENCIEDGFAPRAEGQRGKTAALYRIT